MNALVTSNINKDGEILMTSKELSRKEKVKSNIFLQQH